MRPQGRARSGRRAGTQPRGRDLMLAPSEGRLPIQGLRSRRPNAHIFFVSSQLNPRDGVLELILREAEGTGCSQISSEFSRFIEPRL